MKDTMSYSTISTAKAALNSFIKIDKTSLGKHELTNLLMRGIARQIPRTPKYDTIWDPDVVLKFLKTWSPAKKLNLLQLSIKTTTLVLLVSGQRPQILAHLSLDNMTKNRDLIKFTVTDNLKHTRPTSHATTVELKAHPDKRVCVVHYINHYLQRTTDVRQDRKLFITTTRPYKQATLNTLSRWVKIALQKSGIDTTVFSPGSTRAASTNAAVNRGVPLNTVLKKAAWKSKSTFTKWYKKPVQKEKQFQTAILGKQKDKKK